MDATADACIFLAIKHEIANCNEACRIERNVTMLEFVHRPEFQLFHWFKLDLSMGHYRVGVSFRWNSGRWTKSGKPVVLSVVRVTVRTLQSPLKPIGNTIVWLCWHIAVFTLLVASCRPNSIISATQPRRKQLNRRVLLLCAEPMGTFCLQRSVWGELHTCTPVWRVALLQGKFFKHFFIDFPLFQETRGLRYLPLNFWIHKKPFHWFPKFVPFCFSRPTLRKFCPLVNFFKGQGGRMCAKRKRKPTLD
jgi:hypothetical protein